MIGAQRFTNVRTEQKQNKTKQKPNKPKQNVFEYKLRPHTGGLEQIVMLQSYRQKHFQHC